MATLHVVSRDRRSVVLTPTQRSSTGQVCTILLRPTEGSGRLCHQTLPARSDMEQQRYRRLPSQPRHRQRHPSHQWHTAWSYTAIKRRPSASATTITELRQRPRRFTTTIPTRRRRT